LEKLAQAFFISQDLGMH